MAIAEPYVPVVARRGFTKLRPMVAATDRLSIADKIGLGSFLLLIAIAVLAPVIAPHGPIVPVGQPFSRRSIRERGLEPTRSVSISSVAYSMDCVQVSSP